MMHFNKRKTAIWIVYFVEMIVLLLNDYFIGINYYNGTHILSPFNATLIMNNYSRGFCMRGGIGSLLYIFPFDIDWKRLAVITIIVVLCMYGLLASLGIKIVEKYSYNEKVIVGYAIILMSPIFRIYNAYYIFGGPEVYMCIVTIIALLILIQNNARLLWFAPVLSTIGSLAHQGYIFEYGAVSSFCLLYLAIKSPKRYRYLIVNTVALGGAFVWQQLIWKKQTAEDILYIENYIYLHLGEYKEGLLETINGVGSKLKTGTLSNIRYVYASSFSILLLILLYLPIIAAMLIFVKKVWQNSENKKDKVLSILSIIAPIIAVGPDIILQTDTSRFFDMIFVSGILIQVFMICQKQKSIIVALQECVELVKKHKSLLGICVIWVCSIGCMQWKYGTIYIQNIVENWLKLVVT